MSARAWGPLLAAAEQLDVTPWPVEVVEALRVLRAELEHEARCPACARGGLAADGAAATVLAMFDEAGGYVPDLADLADAVTALSGELVRQDRPRCVDRAEGRLSG